MSNRVVVGMSGGVDSSVAAHLLKEHDYDVVGLFMKNWEEDDEDGYCAASNDLADAQTVCDRLKIPLKTVNFSHEYWENVFAHFLNEYRAGRTPNPDVLCNKEIKFKEFLEHAKTLGAQYIATGHYVRASHRQGAVQLRKGIDLAKDQSYFLYTLPQAALRRSLFPVGALAKPEVREIAQALGLVTHNKKDSTGICFIGERKFRDFLKQYIPPQPGQIRDAENNQIVGEHEGLMYYTLGQRQGLGIGGEGEAWYAVGKNLKQNVLFVAQGHDHPLLQSQIVDIEHVHWVAGMPPALPLSCRAKTRYRQEDQSCVVTRVSANAARVEFHETQRAVTPGQSLVLYQGSECLGGGVINNAVDNNMLHPNAMPESGAFRA